VGAAMRNVLGNVSEETIRFVEAALMKAKAEYCEEGFGESFREWGLEATIEDDGERWMVTIHSRERKVNADWALSVGKVEGDVREEWTATHAKLPDWMRTL